MLNVIGTCLDIKQRLKMADILSGNVMEIGEMGRRFSRFSASIFLHRRSTDDGEKYKENAGVYFTGQSGSTLQWGKITRPGSNSEEMFPGARPSLLRQVSDSLMRRRSSLGAMYHQRRKLSDGWKPLDRDSIVIHKGGIQTLRTISIGVDENSPTDQVGTLETQLAELFVQQFANEKKTWKKQQTSQTPRKKQPQTKTNPKQTKKK